jgi:5'-nucleotidase / UDP-sugar diphosphatase
MKFAISAAIAGLLIGAGCQQSKPGSTDSAALNVSPAPSTVAYAEPAPMTTAAPDPALNAPTPAAAAPSGNTYTIKKGDTLWRIAASHYGDGKKWHEIADANPGLSPSSLRVGATITLP